MSYRELRDATEILRSLGYPRLVSIENFRLPNFALMAELLEWTVRKFDPSSRIPKSIDTETDRVIFVKSCVVSLIQRAHLWLNPKNLYQSDGHAVRELLPALRTLYQVVKSSSSHNQPEEGDSMESGISTSALRSRVNGIRQEMRRSIQSASLLPHAGANVYDLLAREIVAKEARSKALSMSTNSSEVEAALKEKVGKSEQRIAEVRYKLDHLANDEQDVEKKIERRHREYEQLQKRLAKLQSFRPPYMDEYERYETQLKTLYAVYVVLFRNLSHLQQQLWDVERAERNRGEDAERDMRFAVERMKVESEAAAAIKPAENPSGIIERQLKGGAVRGIPMHCIVVESNSEVRVFGNMTGTGLSDDDDNDDVDDDEVDDDDDVDEDDDDEEDEGGQSTMYAGGVARRKSIISGSGQLRAAPPELEHSSKRGSLGSAGLGDGY